MQLQLRTGESSEAIDPGAQLAIRLGLGDWPRVRSELRRRRLCASMGLNQKH
ncbi:hypothetical protein [Paracoccus mutanolyticus]|uniref:hypothetical protein n=1 Tax=Paracoccus mutanolyticus TaxID=1499308 RepID=UPI0037CC8BCB